MKQVYCYTLVYERDDDDFVEGSLEGVSHAIRMLTGFKDADSGNRVTVFVTADQPLTMEQAVHALQELALSIHLAGEE